MSKLTPTPTSNTNAPDFAEISRLIESARQRAYQAVNTALIELYWQVGAHLSAKIKAAEWGEGVVEQLAQHLASTQPGLKGFTRRNLFRMRQFYEAYPDPQIVTALLTQLPWTHNLIILSRSQRPEEREFYLKMAAQQKWSKRELERQYDTALFERVVLNPAKVSPLVTLLPRRGQRVQGQLLGRISRPASRPSGERFATRPARAAQAVSARTRA